MFLCLVSLQYVFARPKKVVNPGFPIIKVVAQNKEEEEAVPRSRVGGGGAGEGGGVSKLSIEDKESIFLFSDL